MKWICVFILFLFFLSSCDQTIDDIIYGEPFFSEAFEQPFDDIWDVVVEVMERNYELEKLNKREKTIISKWDTVFAPIRGHGFRIRVDARIEEEDGNHVVGFRAIQDKNDDLERPLEPDEAEWKYTGRVSVIEQKLLQQVRYHLLKDFPLSPQLQEQLRREDDLRFEEQLERYR